MAFGRWFDLDSNSDGDVLSIKTPRGDEGRVLVFVENLDENPTDFEVEALISSPGGPVNIGGGARALEQAYARAIPERELAAKAARAFAGPLAASAEKIEVKVRKTVGSRIRVFVGWVRDRFWPDDECGRCRAVLKAAIRIARAAAGHVDPQDAIALADFLDLDLPDWLLDFLQWMFGDGIWERIRRIVGRLAQYFNLIDRLVEAICRELGYCPG